MKNIDPHNIGLFWVYQGDVIGVAHAFWIGDEFIPGLIDSPLDHVAIWTPAFHAKNGFSELCDIEYQCVPRGRVLHDRSSGPLVYLDRCLMCKDTKRLIASFFGFSVQVARWESDSHYTTSLCEIHRLFG